MAIRIDLPEGRFHAAVLLGGDSAERDVSLQSGAAVAAALPAAGHRVVEIDPATVYLENYDWRGIDAAFIALHGSFGEDGQVQQILERAGVPYTGSGPEASRLAFSKSASKARFAQHHVPTPSYALIRDTDSPHQIIQQVRHIGYPIVVKPDAQGSSLGVSIVSDEQELPAALSRMFRYGPTGLIEAAVLGTEWTVGLIDEQELPPIRIGTDRAFFDYNAKYHDDDTRYEFETGAPTAVIERISRAARDACRALGTRGLARVDVMLDRHDRPWILEVNTVPGMTSHSLVPKAAARMGINFTELCDRCLSLAFEHAGHAAQSPQRHALAAI